MLPFAHNIPSSQLMATGVRWMFEQPQNLSIKHRRNMQFYCKLPRTGVRCSINDNIACAHVREDRDVHHSIFHRRPPYHLTTSASLKEENMAHPTFRVMRQSCSAYSLSLKYLSSLKPYALRFITFILLFIPSTLAVEI